MISLKRYLDQTQEEYPVLSTEAYRATLSAFGESAVRCCPPTGQTLSKELSFAEELLKKNRSRRNFHSTQSQGAAISALLG